MSGCQSGTESGPNELTSGKAPARGAVVLPACRPEGACVRARVDAVQIPEPVDEGILEARRRVDDVVRDGCLDAVEMAEDPLADRAVTVSCVEQDVFEQRLDKSRAVAVVARGQCVVELDG